MRPATLRSHLFDAAFALWTCLFAFGIPLLWILGSPRRPIRAATRVWVRGTLALLKGIVGLDYVVHGLDLVPDGPCLIVSNHQSPWETLAFLVLFPDVMIVAKHELLKIPIVSWYLAKSPMITIDREAGSTSLKKMLKQSRAGCGPALQARGNHYGFGSAAASAGPAGGGIRQASRDERQCGTRQDQPVRCRLCLRMTCSHSGRIAVRNECPAAFHAQRTQRCDAGSTSSRPSAIASPHSTQ
ncbi:1-acyl-sn-glycerol-3-phosphate acyltransferase [Aurantimonas sp. C2-6-R+9]|uniref:lysophospholipid acyltransferase family protein n=1 Tax=unclassified Aurantimonas TaxID=2638230 RepID=UPI002E186238|nr:1-acyl-sn-glycerol-3-phosphate acyltransferase [Aurantimonas sp. C2-6-R+9]